MTRQEFNEQVLWQFMLDVNEFGTDIAGRLLVLAIKSQIEDEHTLAHDLPSTKFKSEYEL